MDNNKYVVFKIGDWLDEWKQWTDPKDAHHPLTDLQHHRIEDAVVIRQQDMFAGPALQTYAASISIAKTALQGAIPLLEEGPAKDKIHNEIAYLGELADFFHTMAEEAYDKGWKRPD